MGEVINTEYSVSSSTTVAVPEKNSSGKLFLIIEKNIKDKPIIAITSI
jgi:hypothetical protein